MKIQRTSWNEFTWWSCEQYTKNNCHDDKCSDHRSDYNSYHDLLLFWPSTTKKNESIDMNNITDEISLRFVWCYCLCLQMRRRQNRRWCKNLANRWKIKNLCGEITVYNPLTLTYSCPFVFTLFVPLGRRLLTDIVCFWSGSSSLRGALRLIRLPPY